MAAPDMAGFLKVGLDVMSTRVHPTTKKLLAQLGSVGKEQTDPVTGETVKSDASTESDNAEVWQQPGFSSRAPKPVAGQKAPQAVSLCTGDHDIIIAQCDERGRDAYGELGYGETCVQGAGENGTAQARSLYKGDGSLTHMTRKGNTKDGVAIMIQLDAANGAIRLLNDKGYGIIIDGTGVTIGTGGSGAALTLTGAGNASLVASQKANIDGATILLGSIAAPAVNSAIHGPAGIIGVASLKCLIEGWIAPIIFSTLAAHALHYFLT